MHGPLTDTAPKSKISPNSGIPSFLSIVMVIIRKSGTLKIKDTIRLPLSCQTTDLIWNWKVLKRPEIAVWHKKPELGAEERIPFFFLRVTAAQRL